MILDTNAISAMAEDDKLILPVLLGSPDHYLPVIALGEYRHGLLGSQRRTVLEEWLTALLARVPTLPVTEGTTHFYAHIVRDLRTKGRPIPVNDIWIAALALQHDLPVLSRDGHFDEVAGLQRVTW
jgi:predicted nucleic acid-binding protein